MFLCLSTLNGGTGQEVGRLHIVFGTVRQCRIILDRPGQLPGLRSPYEKMIPAVTFGVSEGQQQRWGVTNGMSSFES